jgi:signal transduction histidine kinase
MNWLGLQDELLLTTAAALTAAILGACAGSTGYLLDRLLEASADAPAGLTRADILQVGREATRGLGAVALTVLAFGLPVVYLLIVRALAPLRRLGRAADKVAEGRYETVDLTGPDTVGRLAARFNHMVARVAEQKQRVDQANAKLLEANLDLEQKVADRTAASEAATKRLSAEVAEKEDFLRAVSHDLNAPLRNIDGMVAMIRRRHEQDLSDDVLHRLDRIRHNVAVEAELIGEVLELSRIKTRRGAMEPVKLTQLIWDLRAVFENDLREQGIELRLETELPIIRCERARFRQVFQNLIDNAIKYMGDGPQRSICIGAQVHPDEIDFWVRDTGIGIAEEDAQKIFYVFRRGTGEQSTRVAGKGVGLASVKSIIENYQGAIRVERNADHGCTFRFSINAKYLYRDESGVCRDESGVTVVQKEAA